MTSPSPAFQVSLPVLSFVPSQKACTPIQNSKKRVKIRATASEPSPRTQIIQAARTGDVAQLSRASRTLTESVSEIVNEQGATAMHLAAQNDHVDVVSALFEVARGTGGATVQFGHNDKAARAFVCTPDSQGATALHYAASAGALRSACRLLQLGADSSALDKLGQTPSDCARANGHQELAFIVDEW